MEDGEKAARDTASDPARQEPPAEIPAGTAAVAASASTGASVAPPPASGAPRPPEAARAQGGGRALAGGAAAVAVLAALFAWWSGTSRNSASAPSAVSAPTGAGAPGSASSATGSSATVSPSAVPSSTVSSAQGPAASSAPSQPNAEPADGGSATPDAVAAGNAVAYDLLRAAPDGTVTVAGRTAPGAKVEILIDGKVADTVTAGADGAFVSMTTQPPSAVARRLQARVTGADGATATDAQALTVAPTPEAVADAARAKGASEAEVSAEVAAAQTLAAKPIVADAEGARVLAGAAETLTIDAVSFDASGRIGVAGRGAPSGAALRAYVDNAESGLTSPDAAGGWRFSLPAPSAGEHVLRIDALDAAGKVVARAEQAFQTASPVTAAASDAGPAATAVDPAATAGAPAGISAAAPADGPLTVPTPGRPNSVTVVRGATLWAIARETYGNPMLYVQVFEANKAQIRDPDLIYPGQIFDLPQTR